MTDLLFLGLLSLCLSCLNGQRLESIPSSPVLKRPGETLNLSCKGTGYTFGSYSLHWIRQPAGKPLEWMGRVRTDTGATIYAKGLEGQIEVTKDNSVSLTHLKLSGLKAEDSAVYYCARRTTFNGFDYWGKGTMVTVSSATALAPTVYPLVQCGSGDRDMLTLGCIATGFTPATINFSWKNNAGEKQDNFIQYPSVQIQSSGTYIGVSQVSVKKADLKDKHWTCAVDHSAGSKEVDVKEPVPPTPISPSLYVMAPTKAEMNDNQTASFACLASDFSPEKHTITWLKNNKPIYEEVTHYSHSAKKGKNTLFTATSFLKVNDTDWTDGSDFTCQFLHKSGNQNRTVKYECDNIDIFEEPIEFKFIPPTPKEIYSDEKIPITCEATTKNSGFLSIKWMKEDHTVISEEKFTKQMKNRTVTLTTRISKEEWSQGKEFICEAAHSGNLGESAKYRRENGGQKKRPAVFLLAPTEDTSNNMVTLTCYVKDFYPKEVLVAWLVNDELVEMDSGKFQYDTTSPVETGETYYSVYGQLRMSTNDWEVDGVVYSCAVYHETIAKSTKMLVRTVDRTSNKPNLVNLSLNAPCCKA